MPALKQSNIARHMDADTAFNDAIALGVLTTKRGDYRYAGNFMFMGVVNDPYAFKDINTRDYRFCDVPVEDLSLQGLYC